MKDKNVIEHSQCELTNLSSSLTNLIAILDEMAGSLVILRLISSIINNPDGKTQCILSTFMDDTECFVDIVRCRDLSPEVPCET